MDFFETQCSSISVDVVDVVVVVVVVGGGGRGSSSKQIRSHRYARKPIGVASIQTSRHSGFPVFPTGEEGSTVLGFRWTCLRCDCEKMAGSAPTVLSQYDYLLSTC